MKPSLARSTLAAVITTATENTVSVVDHLPDSITPPCVLIAWADPWLSPSTYCAWEARIELIVIAQRIEPGGKLETLEDIVSDILPAVKALDSYTATDATAPYPLEIAGVSYLAASINITHDMEE